MSKVDLEIERKKHREYMREWRRKNLDKARADAKRSYAKNKSTKKKYDAEYRIIKKEHRSEYNAQYYLEHKERVIERNMAWGKENPDKLDAYRHRRRATINGGGGGFAAKEWQALKKLYANRCLCCGKDNVQLTADHVIPLKMGGKGTIDNIQPLCLSCNCAKRAKDTDYRFEYT